MLELHSPVLALIYQCQNIEKDFRTVITSCIISTSLLKDSAILYFLNLQDFFLPQEEEHARGTLEAHVQLGHWLVLPRIPKG